MKIKIKTGEAGKYQTGLKVALSFLGLTQPRLPDLLKQFCQSGRDHDYGVPIATKGH